MYHITINSKTDSKKSIVELLKSIADKIENGENSCPNHQWTLIEETEKDAKVIKIKSIIGKWGMTTAKDLNLSTSPNGTTNDNVYSLIERFNHYDVEVITYNNGIPIDFDIIEYIDLPDDVLDEVLAIIEDYDAEQTKLNDSIKDFDF